MPTPPLSPDISLFKTDTKTVSHLNTSLPLSDHGGRKVSFHIDAKFFSFSFNGGRLDLYAIHESSWHIKHTIWVGRKGFEWILSCFVDIRDWVPGKVSLCKLYGKIISCWNFVGDRIRLAFLWP